MCVRGHVCITCSVFYLVKRLRSEGTVMDIEDLVLVGSRQK